ncbi:MAG: N-6 DNA methylase [Gemmataceae bacterium]|nr:N-6 DNA methylase [Gemmataceae bacterium]
MLAQLAKQKLESAVRRIPGCQHARVGILVDNPEANGSQALLAVVVEFNRPAPDDALREVHRLAWNFARSPLLITADPVTLRSWSCCEPPDTDDDLFGLAEILEGRLDLTGPNAGQAYVAHALSWLSLISGDFFRRPAAAPHFNRNNAADRLLLENLREVRRQLHAGDDETERPSLDYATIHALLARLMFLQFLEDRRDTEGHAALSPDFFVQRHQDGTLTGAYTSFSEVLSTKADTYRLFGWLNDRFNGDLFPTEAEQRAEERSVTAKHLKFLANFIRGDIQLRQGQRFLWRQYSFDVIPLEFISSIYEEFIHNSDAEPGKGVVYTPGHLVDFILDGVLPWDGTGWDMKVLDPACGSGIFLVKAYERLIHRWKLANPNERPSAAVLRYILERCLYGVDTQEDAVRVASFSLYLAMCDEIDPRRYWTQVRFPRLRGNTINCHDFFEDGPTLTDGGELRKFDVVVGNPPWGREESIPDAVSAWAERELEQRPEENKRSWKASYVSIGPLFLPRAAEVIKTEGTISLLQSSAVLLNDVGTARELRARLFSEFVIEEVVNLAPLRYILFSHASKATAPPAIISMRLARENEPAGEFVYMCPKPARTVEDDYRLLIGPHDVHSVRTKEVLSGRNPLTTLLWGGRRDMALLSKLATLPTLQGKKDEGAVLTRQGINRGDRQRKQETIAGRKILETPNFPESAFLLLNPAILPTNTDPTIDTRASTNLDAFAPPQLLIKLGWMRANGRFRAVRVNRAGKLGVLCSKSYVSVCSPAENEKLLDAACLVYNSNFALYWLYLTNHRLASFIAEATVKDLLRVPLPTLKEQNDGLIAISGFAEVDERVRRALGLHDADWALISDFFTYTLPDFKQLPDAPGGQPTRREGPGDELSRYCDYLLGVLAAAFGDPERFSATIFRDDGPERLAVRLVAIHLNRVDNERVRYEPIASPLLIKKLQELEKMLRAKSTGSGGITFQRVVRVYSDYLLGPRHVPTLYLIKPDQARYWTACAGMRDADEAFNEIMLWEDTEGGNRTAREGA